MGIVNLLPAECALGRSFQQNAITCCKPISSCHLNQKTSKLHPSFVGQIPFWFLCQFSENCVCPSGIYMYRLYHGIIGWWILPVSAHLPMVVTGRLVSHIELEWAANLRLISATAFISLIQNVVQVQQAQRSSCCAIRMAESIPFVRPRPVGTER